jgi:hypothetical protein
VGIFLEGEDSRGDHGLGGLVQFRFKAPPGTTSSSITTHTSVVYTPTMPRREDHEVHKGHVVALEKKKIISSLRKFEHEINLALPNRFEVSYSTHTLHLKIILPSPRKIIFSLIIYLTTVVKYSS